MGVSSSRAIFHPSQYPTERAVPSVPCRHRDMDMSSRKQKHLSEIENLNPTPQFYHHSVYNANFCGSVEMIPFWASHGQDASFAEHMRAQLLAKCSKLCTNHLTTVEISILRSTTFHYITLHYTTLDYITIHYHTLRIVLIIWQLSLECSSNLYPPWLVISSISFGDVPKNRVTSPAGRLELSRGPGTYPRGPRTMYSYFAKQNTRQNIHALLSYKNQVFLTQKIIPHDVSESPCW